MIFYFKGSKHCELYDTTSSESTSSGKSKENFYGTIFNLWNLRFITNLCMVALLQNVVEQKLDAEQKLAWGKHHLEIGFMGIF